MTLSPGLRKQDAKLLGMITTRDEAGTHFTYLYGDKFLNRMEKAGFIKITRPIHEPTGIAYGQEEWTVEVTPAGIEMGEGMHWGADAEDEYICGNLYEDGYEIVKVDFGDIISAMVSDENDSTHYKWDERFRNGLVYDEYKGWLFTDGEEPQE